MTTAADLRARARDEARADVRNLVLDAARAVTLEQGWRAVRMGALAAEVGISRQSLHLEFGTKAAVGSELVHREIDDLLGGLTDAFAEHAGDPLTAMRQAAAHTLASLADNPLLQLVIGGGGDQDLLALLTTRGDWILRQATEVLRTWALRDLPMIDPERLDAMAEQVVRLTLSHGLTPTAPREESVERLVRVAAILVGLPDPGLS